MTRLNKEFMEKFGRNTYSKEKNKYMSNLENLIINLIHNNEYDEANHYIEIHKLVENDEFDWVV